MPGPGPRGPRQTYRAPCSSILDPRVSARNPRKTGKSRRARGTRTRQPGTRSTRDGFSCGEIASAAGGTRPSILDPRRLLNEIRRTALDPRAAQRPRARPSIPGSTRDRIFSPFFVVFARNRQKTAETGRQIWSEFSAKNRELAEIRQFCQIFFRIEARVAPAAERNPPHGSPGRPSSSSPAARYRPAARRPLRFVCPGDAKIRANRIPARANRSGAPAYRVSSMALDPRIRALDPPARHAPSRLQGPCF